MKSNEHNCEEHKQPRSLRRSELCLIGQSSVYRAGILHMWIELDLAKSAFVVGHILMQDRRQGLCLLRAQIYALKVADFNLIFGLLLHSAKN